jgi:hypothetical protein
VKRWPCVVFLMIVSFCFVARAAELDGIQLPDKLQADGKTLYLNGFGLRTYSILNLHIYVASLYLEHPSTNADEILRSPDTKVMNVTFERGISEERARTAWRENLANSCPAPCHLEPEDVERFLSLVPAMNAGDHYSLLFKQNGATVTVNGKQIGSFSKRQFADVMLATFIGPYSRLPELRRALLRGHS